MNANKQEKIYIENDEEITSVIDHIHQVKGNDVLLVVPQRALLLQSVVNLKLLEQEAKKHNKKITLMTRDEDGIAFAARAGITVKPFIAEERKSMEYEENVMPQQIEDKLIPKHAQKIMDKPSTQREQSGLGSQAFFGGVVAQGVSVSGLTPISNNKSDIVIEQEREIRMQEKMAQMDMAPGQKTTPQNAGNFVASQENTYSSEQILPKSPMEIQEEFERQNNIQQVENYTQQNTYDEAKTLNEYEQSLREAQVSGLNNLRQQSTQQPNYTDEHEQEQKYYEQEASTQSTKSKVKKKTKKIKKKPKKQKKQKKEVKISQTTNNLVKGFVAGGIILVFIIFMIIVLPKTKISIQPKEIDLNETIELTAKVDQVALDAERRLIPARLIERDITYTKSFNATGSGDVTAQKAQGTITIFNEYSTAPQPLVATTRFLAEDGTLFRLVNQTVVPGMSGNEPGKVDALVEADIEGEAGNIGPTKFSVPGFDSSPKKDKFYATSDKAMAGGGVGGSGVTIVTEEDITRAKNEMTEEMPKYVEEQIQGLLRPENEVLLPEAIIIEEARSESSMVVGTMTEQFMYEIVSHVKALVFSEDDVLTVLESNLEDKQQQYDESNIDVVVQYDNVVIDFEKQILEMRAHGSASVIAIVDVEEFQEDITGQKHDEILNIMEEGYGDEIEKITIDSVVPGFPAFIANHISRFQFMTKITVEYLNDN